MRTLFLFLIVACIAASVIATPAEALETYASEVLDESRVYSLYGAYDGGEGALGTPDMNRATDPQERAKNGSGWRTWEGYLVLGFSGAALLDGAGDDLTVYHLRTGNGNGNHPPPQLYGSSDESFSAEGMAWTWIGQLSPAPTDAESKTVRVDTFDFAEIGVDEIRYIKIEKNATGKKTGKFIDAVKGHYSTVTDPTNTEPERPILRSPASMEFVPSFTPVLETEPFVDSDTDDTHLATHWQLAQTGYFDEPGYFEDQMICDVTSRSSLTSLSVPPLFLDKGTIYYWRASFFDQRLTESSWSKDLTFTVFVYPENNPDPNDNGIPDAQEIDYTDGSQDIQDLDANGVVDNAEPDRIKCMQAEDGIGQIGVGVPVGGPIIDAARWDAFDSLSGEDLMPDEMPFGLVSFKILMDHPGDMAEVYVYFSGSLPGKAQWYHHNTMKAEWIVFPETAVDFNAEENRVALRLTDGGLGDLDGVANGVVLGCGGPGIQNELPPSVLDLKIEGRGADTADAGGCFIEQMLIFRMGK